MWRVEVAGPAHMAETVWLLAGVPGAMDVS